MSRCSLKSIGVVLMESKTRQIIYSTFVASCSITIGMCLGWTYCAMNVESDDCREYYKEKHQSQVLNNFQYFGAICSAGTAAFVASRFGFKKVLIAGLIITMCGSIAIKYVKGVFFPLLIGRVLHGFGTGIVFVIVPNYAAEIAEPSVRGLLTGFHYVQLLFGTLLSYIIREFYNYSYVDMGIIIMVTLNLIVLLAIEDPSYYRLKFEKRTSVYDFFLKIQDLNRSNLCDRVYKSLNNHGDENSVYLYSVFTEKIYRKPLLINVSLICIQQFVGYSSLLSKLQSLYGSLPTNEKIPVMTAITLLQLIISIVCLLLVGILGRKTVLMISGFGIAITLSIMNVSFDKELVDHDEQWLFCLILIYMTFYSIGFGLVPWIMMPEICPRKSRLWTSGVTVSLYALLNLVNNQSFYENIRLVFRVDVFLLIFTIISLTGAIFVHQYIPETKDCILT